jgi:hypothetical protein
MEKGQMSACPASQIDHAHPLRNAIPQQVDLRLQKRADLWRLGCRVQGPVQQSLGVHLLV